mgnify:CR=1 FL=1
MWNFQLRCAKLIKTQKLISDTSKHTFTFVKYPSVLSCSICTLVLHENLSLLSKTFFKKVISFSKSHGSQARGYDIYCIPWIETSQSRPHYIRQQCSKRMKCLEFRLDSSFKFSIPQSTRGPLCFLFHYLFSARWGNLRMLDFC